VRPLLRAGDLAFFGCGVVASGAVLHQATLAKGCGRCIRQHLAGRGLDDMSVLSSDPLADVRSHVLPSSAQTTSRAQWDVRTNCSVNEHPVFVVSPRPRLRARKDGWFGAFAAGMKNNICPPSAEIRGANSSNCGKTARWICRCLAAGQGSSSVTEFMLRRAWYRDRQKFPGSGAMTTWPPGQCPRRSNSLSGDRG